MVKWFDEFASRKPKWIDDAWLKASPNRYIHCLRKTNRGEGLCVGETDYSKHYFAVKGPVLQSLKGRYFTRASGIWELYKAHKSIENWRFLRDNGADPEDVKQSARAIWGSYGWLTNYDHMKVRYEEIIEYTTQAEEVWMWREFEELRDWLEAALKSQCLTPGQVYFVQEDESHFVKIGKAQDVSKRLSGLQVGSPHVLSIYHTVQCPDDYSDAERCLGEMFRTNHVRGEWYKLDEVDLQTVRIIKRVGY